MKRLDKFLADAGLGTRSEVKLLIRKGKVIVDGVVIRQPEHKVDDGMHVVCQGEAVQEAPAFLYYLLNKPAGYVSATEDAREKTVLDLLPRDKRRTLFPVGRLDKDTEGLLLITDDGPLAHALLSPQKHVDKTYFVRVDAPVEEEGLKVLLTGVDIGDEKLTLPATYQVLSPKELLLTIHEGRFHQVKRMMEAVEKTVVYLKRLSMGGLTLPKDLAPGEYRVLTEEEIRRLFRQK